MAHPIRSSGRSRSALPVCGAGHVVLSDLHINFENEAPKINEGPDIHAGKWIGILERLAILILIPLNQWAAVGLLLTAKSIARHSKMNEARYAEYFLIGTLLSLIIAVVGGLLISRIWAQPDIRA